MDLIASFIPMWVAQNSSIPVSGVSLDVTAGAVPKAATRQLTATVSPANATNKAVTWSSSDESVATVNSSGLVSGVAVGAATITVTTVDGSFTATFSAEVVAYLWQGTRSGKGITANISGNRVTLSGTATSAFTLSYTDNTTGLETHSETWSSLPGGATLKSTVTVISGTTTSTGIQFAIRSSSTDYLQVRSFSNPNQSVTAEKTNTGDSAVNLPYIRAAIGNGNVFDNLVFDVEYYIKKSGESEYTRWW